MNDILVKTGSSSPRRGEGAPQVPSGVLQGCPKTSCLILILQLRHRESEPGLPSQCSEQVRNPGGPELACATSVSNFESCPPGMGPRLCTGYLIGQASLAPCPPPLDLAAASTLELAAHNAGWQGHQALTSHPRGHPSLGPYLDDLVHTLASLWGFRTQKKEGP